MIVREIKQHELRDQDFTEERHNTFFLSELQEVKLRTRENTTQHRTYVSEQDYVRLSPKQQAAYGANGLNPKLFYCAGEGVAHAPTTRAAKAAKAATKKARRHYSGSRVGIGGRPFSWESEVGEFIVMELSSHSDYLVKQTGSGVQAYERRTNRRMDKDSLLALRSKFELERGDKAAACVRSTNSIKLVKPEGDDGPAYRGVGWKQQGNSAYEPLLLRRTLYEIGDPEFDEYRVERQRIVDAIPRELCAEENDVTLYAHLFLGPADWYVATYDPETDEAYCFVVGLEEEEWGAEWLRALETLQVPVRVQMPDGNVCQVPGPYLECDIYWQPITFGELKARRAGAKR